MNKKLPTVRQALKQLRASNLPDYMSASQWIPLCDGTYLEVYNKQSSDGSGYLLGVHVAKRYRSGEEIASYKI